MFFLRERVEIEHWDGSPVKFTDGSNETKDIFHTGEDVIPAMVKEQRLFFLKCSKGAEDRELETMMTSFNGYLAILGETIVRSIQYSFRCY